MKEQRNLKVDFKVDERNISGYALKFNSESRDLGGFTETIEPTALDGVIERSDIKAVWNHDTNQVPFGRSRNGEGSLQLEVDDIGLRYSYTMPDTALGNEVLEAVKRGDVDSNSFVFTVDKEGQKWSRNDGATSRTITQFDKLFDVSLVSDPAYTDAKVDSRGYKELDKIEAAGAEYDALVKRMDEFKDKE